MAKVKIQGNASGTGTLTLTAPNTNSDRTITLPDGTGELLAKDSSGKVGIGTSSPSGKLDVAMSDSAILVLSHETRSGQHSLGHSGVNSEFLRINHNGTRNALFGSDYVAFEPGGSERMRIDNAGRVTMPYQPAFSARGQLAINGHSLSLPNGSHVKVSLGNSHFDRGGDLNNSTSRFTAPVAGVYQFTLNYSFQTSFSATHHRISFWKNGSQLAIGECDGYDRMHAEGIYLGKKRTELITLSAGDYIEPYCSQDSGSTQSLRNCMTTFSGHLIG